MRNQILCERKAYALMSDQNYVDCFNAYVEVYEKRKPGKSSAIKNMLKALRMIPHMNTADDWARLHATEIYLKRK